MFKNIVKPAAALLLAAAIVGGYIAGIVYKIIPTWLGLCLSPLVLLAFIALIILLGGFVVLFSAILSDGVAGIKGSLLQRYGVETEAVIIHSEMYYGPGLHSADPCYRGKYTFTDLRGREYTFTFKGDCFEPVDIVSLNISLEDHYRIGAKRRVSYLKQLPALHQLHRPNVAAPIVRGSSTGLHKLE